jgi:hypothetical protein
MTATQTLEDKVRAQIKACQDTLREHELLVADQGGEWVMRSHYEGILHALEWTLKEVRSTIYLEFQMETAECPIIGRQEMKG